MTIIHLASYEVKWFRALPDLGDGLSFIDQFEAECEDRHVAFGVESDDLGVLGQ